jgi:hypothetical protein
LVCCPLVSPLLPLTRGSHTQQDELLPLGDARLSLSRAVSRQRSFLRRHRFVLSPPALFPPSCADSSHHSSTANVACSRCAPGVATCTGNSAGQATSWCVPPSRSPSQSVFLTNDSTIAARPKTASSSTSHPATGESFFLSPRSRLRLLTFLPTSASPPPTAPRLSTPTTAPRLVSSATAALWPAPDRLRRLFAVLLGRRRFSSSMMASVF